MQDIIKLLPDSVANQIAAGEVIQQPASVIKELIENAVDAGATKIDVFIKDAGRTMIQVIDNGCGMTATDARLAFERHSTSKIREAKDLFSLTTMGFRGEALASIAAISQIDVRTMPHDASMGTRLIINGSKVESQGPEVTSAGTNFIVKNLFYNAPARRKFLKKDSVEFGNILHEFERLVLVNPGVEMSLYHNDQLIHSLSKSNLKTRIGELFGRQVEDSLVTIECNTDIVKISGYIGSPTSVRKRGALQYFFVNGRNMRHPYFRKAVLNNYENLILADSQPNYFINFEIDPESIDVNIHPTKNEIKFENEHAIWQLLSASVKEALGRYNLGPSIDFDNPVQLLIDEFPVEKKFIDNNTKNTIGSPPKGRVNTKTESGFISERRKIIDWEKLYDGKSLEININQEELPLDIQYQPSKYLQLDGKYILLPSSQGLYIINQRNAHIRIIYDSLLNQIRERRVASQNLLFSTYVTFDSLQSIILTSIIDSLEDCGFSLRQQNNDEWEIKAIPSVLNGCDCTIVLTDIVNNIMEETAGNEDTVDCLQRIITLAVAKASAIKSGQSLTQDEMENLVSSLFISSSPSIGPDGEKIVGELKMDSILKVFDS